MKKYWVKRSEKQIKERVFQALDKNIDFREHNILGVPASHLDEKVFSPDAAFLKDMPFVSTLVQNPNHIGCHTLGTSERFFQGTQQLEREVIDICAVDILQADPDTYDGYVASGGTEANLQAIWIYRNYFLRECHAKLSEVVLLCSQDSHYSMDKAGNVLILDIAKIPVEKTSRKILPEAVRNTIQEQQQKGKRYFIVVANMMTTMFGSVDDVDVLVATLKDAGCPFRLHVDGAYGGFYYPFTDEFDRHSFQNPDISSFTLDAHKMAQAPYGTGIFIIRKGLIHFANTKEASYIEGEDYTLIGSRSGANAVAVWMILSKHGPYSWQEKIYILQKRSEWMCRQLAQLGISYYRHPGSNIITIGSTFIRPETVEVFGLIPDNHAQPNWYKIVIMEHVTIEKLMSLVEQLAGTPSEVDHIISQQ
ncbi:MAG: pyridoxal-dependent decarboxylase [Saprospiraceae bacterium]|nr:aspartate aminotransferase family protein [Lewinella sp.]